MYISDSVGDSRQKCPLSRTQHIRASCGQRERALPEFCGFAERVSQILPGAKKFFQISQSVKKLWPKNIAKIRCVRDGFSKFKDFKTMSFHTARRFRAGEGFILCRIVPSFFTCHWLQNRWIIVCVVLAEIPWSQILIFFVPYATWVLAHPNNCLNGICLCLLCTKTIMLSKDI